MQTTEKQRTWMHVLRLVSDLTINKLGRIRVSDKQAVIEYDSAFGKHILVLFSPYEPDEYIVAELLDGDILRITPATPERLTELANHISEVSR